MPKRLAPVSKLKKEPEPEFSGQEIEEEPPLSSSAQTKKTETFNDLHIVNYTEKSFMVLGNTLSHANALGRLGGSLTNLKGYGVQWFFAGIRRDSVQKYINEGAIEPFKYTEEMKAAFASNKKSAETNSESSKIKILFKELRDAFDKNLEYDGASIFQVIELLEKKYS